MSLEQLPRWYSYNLDFYLLTMSGTVLVVCWCVLLGPRKRTLELSVIRCREYFAETHVLHDVVSVTNILSSAWPLPNFHSIVSFIAFSNFEALKVPSFPRGFFSEKTCLAKSRYLSIASGTDIRRRPRRRAIRLCNVKRTHRYKLNIILTHQYLYHRLHRNSLPEVVLADSEFGLCGA